MNVALNQVRYYFKTYPVIKGIVSYGVIWPVGSLIQQTISGSRWDSYDWKKCLRYSLYGGLFVAPTLYCWVRLSTRIWPKMTLKNGITKAIVEQLTYGPAAMSCFFFCMNVLEGGTFTESCHEVRDKFWPTYKIAICFWPIFQTINFTFVKERNRVPVVSLGSLGWTTFLAYMKQLEIEKKEHDRQDKMLERLKTDNWDDGSVTA